MPQSAADTHGSPAIWAQRYWFYIEMYYLLSIVISYMFFFIFRSLTKHKIYPEDFQKLKSIAPDTETVQALEKLEIMFLNAFSPMFITVLIVFTPNEANNDHKEDLLI